MMMDRNFNFFQVLTPLFDLFTHNLYLFICGGKTTFLNEVMPAYPKSEFHKTTKFTRHLILLYQSLVKFSSFFMIIFISSDVPLFQKAIIKGAIRTVKVILKQKFWNNFSAFASNS